MASFRQLAAIMFTDIVGYTALMGEDEQKAFDLLRINRQRQKPLVEQFNGRWIKELGDGILVSFLTVTDAVSCAVAIQRACEEAQDLKLRIGIHLGEVVFENDDVFGDGVNIASRLQGLAPAGAIWVSEAVYKNVSNKKEITARFVGEKEAKNVKEPLRIYEITTGEAASQVVKPASSAQQRVAQKPLARTKTNNRILYLSGLTIFLLAVLGFGYWQYSKSTARQIRSIAVMPFINESRSTDLEYLSDGMTETLISSLSQLPSVNVKPRSSVFRYKSKTISAPVVGKELNVQAVLNGTMVQRGKDLALHIELIDAEKEEVLWSGDYKQPMANLVSLQHEITRDVSQKIKRKLSGADEQKLSKHYTVNSEAYQLYLKGRFHWNRRTEKDVEKAIDYFGQAITLDPNFALAYAGLADAYASPLGGTPSQEKMVKGREAVLKALSLDDNLAEAHAAYGRVLTAFDYNFTAAERAFRRAVDLNPNYALTYERYAILLAYKGQFEEALNQIRRALEIEPLNLNFTAIYGLSLIYFRRYDEAIAQFNKALELDANFQPAHNFLSYVYWLKGAYAQSAEKRAKGYEVVGDTLTAAQLRQSFASGGWTGFLRLLVRKSLTPGTRFYGLATYHAALGEKDAAFLALNKALENRESLLASINVDPRLDPLRSDARYEALVKRIGFK